MGRLYAGVLGPLAMVVVICRGLLNSSGPAGTFTTATLALAGFAIVGAILGHIAQSTVDESVRQKIEQELAAQHESAAPT
jgi:hypothetical protein